MEPLTATVFFPDTEELKDGFELLPVGTHVFEVTDIKTGTAKTGRGRLGLQVQIVGGPGDGKKGWDNWNLPTSEDAEKQGHNGRIFKFWRKLAELCPGLVQGNQVFAERLVGLRYKGNVVHGEYQGKPQGRIEWPYPLGMGAEAAASAEKAGASGPAMFQDNG